MRPRRLDCKGNPPGTQRPIVAKREICPLAWEVKGGWKIVRRELNGTDFKKKQARVRRDLAPPYLMVRQGFSQTHPGLMGGLPSLSGRIYLICCLLNSLSIGGWDIFVRREINLNGC